MSIRSRKIVALMLILHISGVVNAGAYLFSGEGNGLDVVTHPNTYAGNAGITVLIRISSQIKTKNLSLDLAASCVKNAFMIALKKQ